MTPNDHDANSSCSDRSNQSPVLGGQQSLNDLQFQQITDSVSFWLRR